MNVYTCNHAHNVFHMHMYGVLPASSNQAENHCSLWRLPSDYENVSVDETSSSVPELEKLATFDSGDGGDLGEFKTLALRKMLSRLSALT